MGLYICIHENQKYLALIAKRRQDNNRVEVASVPEKDISYVTRRVKVGTLCASKS
jgi:hypothetical protein